MYNNYELKLGRPTNRVPNNADWLTDWLTGRPIHSLLTYSTDVMGGE